MHANKSINIAPLTPDAASYAGYLGDKNHRAEALLALP